jgi:hypothetical protein
MKSFFYTIALVATLLAGGYVHAQSDEYLNIGLVMPESHTELSAEELDRLQSRLLQVFVRNGVSAEAGANGIIAYPKVTMYTGDRVQAGISTLFVREAEVCLFVGQADKKAVFASECITVKGSGKDDARAIQAAIKQVDPGASVWSKFIQSTKTEIAKYYEAQCPTLLAKADQLRQTGRLEEAFYNLYNIPAEVSCYKDASQASISIYKQYINEACARNLQLAKARLAANDYKGALRVIGWIDPTAACHSEAMQVMNAAAADLDAETLRYWNFYKARVEKSEELEALRIEAIRDIGVAWGQRNTVVNWNIIK